MLTDVKSWLETTGYKAAEIRFNKPPALPYLLFIDDTNVGGADEKNFTADRNISIELYSERIDREAESKVEALLNEKAIKFKKSRNWIDSEKFFQTVYDFIIYEKI